jgi:putative transposase
LPIHRQVNVSTVFAGQVAGICEVDDKIWLAGRPYPSFMDYDPGYFDEEEARVEPGPNPFVPEV